MAANVANSVIVCLILLLLTIEPMTTSNSNPPRFLIVVIGQEGSGKSAFTIRFVQDYFIDEYDPTISDSFRKIVTIDGERNCLDILDTISPLPWGPEGTIEKEMEKADGIILLYSISNRESYENLELSRETFINIKGKKPAPMVMVGNKCDLNELRVVSTQEASDLAKKWEIPFLEASAKLRINFEQPFFDLLCQIKKLADPNQKSSTAAKPKSGCAIM
jgi:small GTP-binding protein